MAHTEKLPEEMLLSIARQIGRRLASPDRARRLSIAPGAPQLELGESFPVYTLGQRSILDGLVEFADVVKATPYWHHQIRQPGSARHSARSREGEVVELVSSSIASRIDQAIDWIDTHVDGDPVVRLVLIPAYLLTLLWLHSADFDRLIVVDRPARLADVLELEKIYESRDLLSVLSRTPVVSMPTRVQDPAV